MRDTTSWTPAADKALREYLARPGYQVARGRGSEEAAGSMSAINLALTGELTCETPLCMSAVVGEWINVVQPSLPRSALDSREWRDALPLAAATGRGAEAQRLGLLFDWTWESVLPRAQAMADGGGYGAQWRAVCERRVVEPTFDDKQGDARRFFEDISDRIGASGDERAALFAVSLACDADHPILSAAALHLLEAIQFAAQFAELARMAERLSGNGALDLAVASLIGGSHAVASESAHRAVRCAATTAEALSGASLEDDEACLSNDAYCAAWESFAPEKLLARLSSPQPLASQSLAAH